MADKLLTIEELSSYLGVSDEKIRSLVDEGVLFAYKIGGEFLRFRKEQIDAIRSEIEPRIKDFDRISVSAARSRVKERHRMVTGRSRRSAADRIQDFFYFYDFYMISGVIILALLFVIFKN